MTDWIMVSITFVYVVATIFICIFNYRSAKAAREQIELSKTQYEDDTRLKLMPCLIIEGIVPTAAVDGMIQYVFDNAQDAKIISGEFCLKVTNVGSGIAKSVTYRMPPAAKGYRKYTAVSMPVNDSRIVRFFFLSERGTEKKLEITIFYSDLLDHQYSQTLSIYLNCHGDTIRVETMTTTAPHYNHDLPLPRGTMVDR